MWLSHDHLRSRGSPQLQPPFLLLLPACAQLGAEDTIPSLMMTLIKSWKTDCSCPTPQVTTENAVLHIDITVTSATFVSVAGGYYYCCCSLAQLQLLVSSTRALQILAAQTVTRQPVRSIRYSQFCAAHWPSGARERWRKLFVRLRTVVQQSFALFSMQSKIVGMERCAQHLHKAHQRKRQFASLT